MPTRPSLVIAAAGVAAASAWRARRGDVDPSEADVFDAINHAPDALRGPAWLVMQSGSLGAVVATSGVLHRRGRTRAATLALITGTAAWGGVKLIKPLVGRGRPTEYVEGARVRGAAQSGLGYPSGHAAVSLTLILIATEGCPMAIRRVAVGLGLATGLARIYVGAHLPLDVVGGTALGTVIGLSTAELGIARRTAA